MPNASVSEFIVVAVPIVLHQPVDGADEATSSRNCRHHFTGLPDNRARSGALALEPAVEHWPDRQCDRRNIDRRRRHQAGRRRLVAADRQHHAIQRIAVDRLDKAEILQVAVEPGGRALAGFLDGMRRKLDRDPAGVADTVAHPLGEFEMMAVARGQIAAGLRDTDDRPARLKLVDAETIIQITLEIERGHVRIFRIVEPGTRP